MKKIYKNLENFSGFLPNFSYFLSSNVISYFFSFFIIVIFARNYSSQAFGEFTIAQTVFFLIYSVSFSNIHYYLNKSLSLKFQNRRKDIASCFLITFYSSIALYLLIAFILTFLNIKQELKYLILILNLILLSEPFSIFYSELFVRGQFKLIFKIRFFQTAIFFFIKLYIIFNDYSYLFLALSYFLENLLFSIIIIYFFKENGNKFKNLIFSKKHTILILKKIILFPLLAFVILVSMRIDVLMISNLLGSDEAGYYSSVSRIITIILLFGTHFFQFIYPNLNRIIPDTQKFNNIYQNLVLISFSGGLFFYVMSIFFGEMYLSLFGTDFIVALNSLKILSLNIGIALTINLWVHKQYVQSNYTEILVFQTLTIFLNITLNYYLISIFGINGASLATAGSAFISIMVVNLMNPKEIYLIFSSFSISKQKQLANAILKIIFVNKNPDKLDKIKD